ncbi:hypothetical protein JMJ77_0006141 [Colletotrichum scovillei]|uniref:Uncharacterized protein n=1 Tax=Colletotrichum scovillei TaxID=1209932 RepID=A0A9P7RKG4_9PEZI|nr:hypothetical protein JMJ77_0006141 [Colletotrichum scovillei]KAG7077374.1 hypothetical protein JMJ76_0014622 [Colletotrichum scovillei]KAG7084484.1 hypothetical protein JMJ78_0009919 [Colletotrichum scovillei]
MQGCWSRYLRIPNTQQPGGDSCPDFLRSRGYGATVRTHGIGLQEYKPITPDLKFVLPLASLYVRLSARDQPANMGARV